MSEESKLKNCPFCGSRASVVSCWNSARKGYYINAKCDNRWCGASITGGISLNQKDPFDDSAYYKAVELWNERTEASNNE